jgi:hypothetical protein
MRWIAGARKVVLVLLGRVYHLGSNDCAAAINISGFVQNLWLTRTRLCLPACSDAEAKVLHISSVIFPFLRDLPALCVSEPNLRLFQCLENLIRSIRWNNYFGAYSLRRT